MLQCGVENLKMWGKFSGTFGIYCPRLCPPLGAKRHWYANKLSNANMPRTNVVLSICYTIWRWRMTMTSQRGQTGGCARQDTPRKFLSNRRSEGERSGERDPYLHIHRLTRKHHALSQWEHRLVNFRLCFPRSQPASQLASQCMGQSFSRPGYL